MYVLKWWIQGAELAADEGRSAAVLAACRTLAEELTESRFPAPRILAFKVFPSENLRDSQLLLMFCAEIKMMIILSTNYAGRELPGEILCFPAHSSAQGSSI